MVYGDGWWFKAQREGDVLGRSAEKREKIKTKMREGRKVM